MPVLGFKLADEAVHHSVPPTPAQRLVRESDPMPSKVQQRRAYMKEWHKKQKEKEAMTQGEGGMTTTTTI